MINFYQEWKDEKDSKPKVGRKRGRFKCIICEKRTNSLSQHMDAAHGPGTHSKFIKAEALIKERQRQELLTSMDKL